MVLWIGGVLLLIHERKRLGIKDNGLGVGEVTDFITYIMQNTKRSAEHVPHI
jgi:hypothetical protein